MQNEDQTRKILNLIREGKLNPNKSLIREQEEAAPTEELAPTDEMTPTDEFETAETEEQGAIDEDGDQELDEAELKEEKDKFRQSVHNRVEFNTFKLYPNSQNVEWSGTFTDSRIEWNYSLDDTQGVYVSCELTQLRDDTLETLKKLVGYYKAWSDEWATRIAEEYNDGLDSAEEEPEQGGFEPGDDLPDEEEPFV
jgi:hypothetical protein